MDLLVSSGMKGTAIFLVFIFCSGMTSTLSSFWQFQRMVKHITGRSSFWQFQRMVKHITGRSAFFSYYGYGCYCGLGGRGLPVDATDRCSWAHDCCYHKLKDYGCQPILNAYQFAIVKETMTCGCTMGGGCLCAQKACECDKQSVYCFKENLATYEKAFKQLFPTRPQYGRDKLQC